jgi:oligogalacturonide lyase
MLRLCPLAGCLIVTILALSGCSKPSAHNAPSSMGASLLSPQPVEAPARDDWVDQETGHRVICLTRFASLDSGTLYFHQQVFTSEGDKTLFTGYADRATRRFYSLDLKTLQARQLTFSGTDIEALAPKSRTLYYLGKGGICGTNIDTGETRIVATMPRGWQKGCRLSVNADETLLAGSAIISGTGHFPPPDPNHRANGFNDTFAARQTNVLFTINIKSGEVREIHRIDTWLGHVQFSPKEPALLMYCHEGPWLQVDRIWLIRTDSGKPWCAFMRQEPGEIAGHEFWHPDGRTVWFDNSVRGANKHSLACVDIATGKVTRYPLKPEFGSAHFNWAPDGSFIANEGNAANKWLFALRIKDGAIEGQRLLSMEKHDYKWESNVHVSPDSKWVLFSSAMQGKGDVYKVEVAAAK